MHRYTSMLGKRFTFLLFNGTQQQQQRQELVSARSTEGEKTDKSNRQDIVRGDTVKASTSNDKTAVTNDQDKRSSANTTFSRQDQSPLIARSPSTSESEEMLLDLLLGEAQGNLRLNTKIADLTLSATEIRPLDARQRFRLGMGVLSAELFLLPAQFKS